MPLLRPFASPIDLARQTRRLRRLVAISGVLLLALGLKTLVLDTRWGVTLALQISTYRGCTCDDCLRAFLGIGPPAVNYAPFGGVLGYGDPLDIAIRELVFGAVLFAIGVLGGPLVRMAVDRLAYQVDHCRACNYDLTGLRDGRCPECGLTIETPDQAAGPGGDG